MSWYGIDKIQDCNKLQYAESERLQRGRKLSRLYNSFFFTGFLCIAHCSSASEHLPPGRKFSVVAFTKNCNLRC